MFFKEKCNYFISLYLLSKKIKKQKQLPLLFADQVSV